MPNQTFSNASTRRGYPKTANYRSRVPEIQPSTRSGPGPQSSSAFGPLSGFASILNTIGSNRGSGSDTAKARLKWEEEARMAEGEMTQNLLDLSGIEMLPETFAQVMSSDLAEWIQPGDIQALDRAHLTVAQYKRLQRQSPNRASAYLALVELKKEAANHPMVSKEILSTGADILGKPLGQVIDELRSGSYSIMEKEEQDYRDRLNAAGSTLNMTRSVNPKTGEMESDTDYFARVTKEVAKQHEHQRFMDDLSEKRGKNEISQIDAMNSLREHQNEMVTRFGVLANQMGLFNQDVTSWTPEEQKAFGRAYENNFNTILAQQAERFHLTSDQLLSALPQIKTMHDMATDYINSTDKNNADVISNRMKYALGLAEMGLLNRPGIPELFVALKHIGDLGPVVNYLPGRTPAELGTALAPAVEFLLKMLSDQSGGKIEPPKDKKTVSDTISDTTVLLKHLYAWITNNPEDPEKQKMVDTAEHIVTNLSNLNPEDLTPAALDKIVDVIADKEKFIDLDKLIPADQQARLAYVMTHYLQQLKDSATQDLSVKLTTNRVPMVNPEDMPQNPVVANFFGIKITSGLPNSLTEAEAANTRGDNPTLAEVLEPTVDDNGRLTFIPFNQYAGDQRIEAKANEMNRLYSDRFTRLIHAQAHLSGNEDYHSAADIVFGNSMLTTHIGDDPFIKEYGQSAEKVKNVARDVFNRDPHVSSLYEGDFEQFWKDFYKMKTSGE